MRGRNPQESTTNIVFYDAALISGDVLLFSRFGEAVTRVRATMRWLYECQINGLCEHLRTVSRDEEVGLILAAHWGLWDRLLAREKQYDEHEGQVPLERGLCSSSSPRSSLRVCLIALHIPTPYSFLLERSHVLFVPPPQSSQSNDALMTFFFFNKTIIGFREGRNKNKTQAYVRSPKATCLLLQKQWHLKQT